MTATLNRLSIFAQSLALDAWDFTLYHVGDWKKVGEAEAFMFSMLQKLNSGSWVDWSLKFDATEEAQTQARTACTSLRRLTNGYVKNARSTDPAKPKVEVEGRYPEFVILPIFDGSTIPVTVPVTKKNATTGKLEKVTKNGKVVTKVVQRKVICGVAIHERAAFVAARTENAS